MHLGLDTSEYAGISHPVAAIRKEYGNGHATPVHRHSRSQLVCAVSGVMTITADVGIWVIPANRAVWIPERADHEIRMKGQVSMRTLYIDRGWLSQQPQGFETMELTPLTRELVKEAAALLEREGTSSRYDRVLAVLRDQLRSVAQDPMHLPLPSDMRLKMVTESLMRGEGEDLPMQEWAKRAGASVRNLRRLFVKETGMTFVRWRQKARLLEALRLLAGGESVTDVALQVGYENSSAFITAFKKELGTTPRQYFLPSRGGRPDASSA